MPGNYSVSATLSAVDKGFTSTLKNAIGGLDSLGSRIKSGLGFGLLTGMGQQAFSSLTSGARGLISEMNSSSAAWKTFAGNMQIMGKGEGEINSVKKELQSFAEQTIYSSSDMAQTYAQLAAVGTKDTAKLVKGFGGLASAAENPQQAMKTLSQQATQMAARPTVAWQDFKLMLEQSPAGMAAVAKQMGMTTSELVSGIQDGEVSTKAFFDAIQKVGTSKAFTDLATQYKTAGQAMSGLKETLSNKLAPAFDLLSGMASKSIGKIIGKLEKLDGQKIADKISGWIKKAQPYWNSFSKGVQKVGQIIGKVAAAIGPKFKKMGVSMGGSIGKILKAFENIDVDKISGQITKFLDSLEPFISAFKEVGAEVWTGLGEALKAVVGILPKITEFFNNNKETIAKVMPWILRAVLAFKGFKILKSIVPGFGLLTGAIGKLVKGGFGKLAGKFKKTGGAAAVSASDMLKSAGSYALMGAAVFLIAAGFALLANSAISLANAGGGAIAIMGVMTIALIGLMVGMGFLMKMLAPMSGQLLMVGGAFLMMGGAVLLIAAGFWIMSQAAIALAAAGWPAIAVMIGIIAAIALLAIGAAVLGTALTAGAVGFLAFGAAVLMVGAAFMLMGVGAMLAATALQLFVAILPILAANGLQGAFALVAIGAALLVFGAAALVAGAGTLVLGAGLLVIGVAVLTIATGFMLMAVAIMLAATGLSIFAAILPVLAANGLKGSLALVTLGAALVVFGASALAASAGVLLLGAGLIIVGAAVLLIATGFMLMSVAMLLAGAGLAIITALLPALNANGLQSASTLVMLGAAFIVFGAGALVAGAGALVLGAGLLVCATAALVLCAGVLVLGAAIAVMSAGALLASAALAVLSMVLPTLAAQGMAGAAAILALSAALLVFAAGSALAGAGALICSAGVIALGAALLAACVGTLAMAAALLAVTAEMKSIAKNAKSAEKSLTSMRKSVDVVESGLKTIGNIAKSAMKSLINAFDNTASDVKASGKRLADGFVNAVKSGLMKVPTVALLALTMTTAVLNSGYSMAYDSGANIGRGFSNGMLSMLGVIQGAASKMAAAADKAIKAKAKIGSPSKVADKLGTYYGEGYAGGLIGMTKKVRAAAEKLISIPAISTPDLALAYAGEMGADYDYYRNAEYKIIVPVEIDGREVARTTAPYTEAELNKRQKIEDRKHGRR